MKRTFFTLMLLGLGLGAAAQELQTLREYLEAGLERNYDIRIIRNEERISDNNATAANAGKLPTIDLSAGYTGRLDNDRTTPRGGAGRVVSVPLNGASPAAFQPASSFGNSTINSSGTFSHFGESVSPINASA